MTDPTAAIEVWARLLCAADVHVHGDDHPTWQNLVGEPGSRIRDDYRKAAAWLLPRLTVSVVAPAIDRESIRRACATADGYRYEDLEPDDYQHHADEVLALLAAAAPAGVVPATDRAGAAFGADLASQTEAKAGSKAATDQAALREQVVAAIKASPFDELRTVDHAPNGPLQITVKVDDLTDVLVRRLTAASAVVVRRAADETLGEAERCGLWGGCPLPRGHNMGQADIPENHQRPAVGAQQPKETRP